MCVIFGEALMKGGRAFLSICPLQWMMELVFAFGMIGGLVRILQKIAILSFICSAVKDACISEVLWAPEGGSVRVWNLRFYRAFEDWELAASYFFSLSILVFLQVIGEILFARS